MRLLPHAGQCKTVHEAVSAGMPTQNSALHFSQRLQIGFGSPTYVSLEGRRFRLTARRSVRIIVHDSFDGLPAASSDDAFA